MKTRALFLALALSLISTAYGYLIPEQGDIVVEAEYLYLQPLIENGAYVIRVTPTANGNPIIPEERLVNTFGGHSGVRLTGKYGLYECSNNHLSGSWTYLQGVDHDKLLSSNRELLPTTLFPPNTSNGTPFNGSAASTIEMRYHDADLVCNHHLTDDYAFDLFLLGGVQFLYLDYREEIVYNDITFPPSAVGSTTVTQDADRWGVGLKTGFDFLYGLPCWCARGDLSVHAKATGGLLVTCNRVTYRFADTIPATLAFQMQNEKFSYVVPAAELKVGFNYILCFCKGDVAAEVGYNLIYYPNLIDQVRFDGGAGGTTGSNSGGQGLSFDDYTGLGLHGLYAGIGICF